MLTFTPQALRLKVEDGEVVEVVSPYMDDGSKFSGSTVVLHYGDKLLMGSVFTKALYCEVNYIG